MHEIWVFSGSVRLNSQQESFRYRPIPRADHRPPRDTAWRECASVVQLHPKDNCESEMNADCEVLTRKCTNPSRDTGRHHPPDCCVWNRYYILLSSSVRKNIITMQMESFSVPQWIFHYTRHGVKDAQSASNYTQKINGTGSAPHLNTICIQEYCMLGDLYLHILLTAVFFIRWILWL